LIGKVKKETIPIPSKDVSLVEKTFESWHPPPTLATLIPHVQEARLKKKKLKKNCPRLSFIQT